MNYKTMTIAAALFALVTINAWTEVAGRDVANTGVRQTVSGTLRAVDDEWELVTPNGVYALHCGMQNEEATQVFKEGDEAVVDGFVLDLHIAPVTIASQGKTVKVWTETRLPVWSGNGRGRNRDLYGEHED